MKAYSKTVLRQITNHKGHYFSILMIVILGVAFYVGIRATKPYMQMNADHYFDDSNFMDIEIISQTGFNMKDIELLESIEGIDQVMPAFSLETMLELEDTSLGLILYSFDVHKNKDELINVPTLLEGRFPVNENECIVDQSFIDLSNYSVGDTITFTYNKEYLKYEQFKIVGLVMDPRYISIERGSSKLSGGELDGFILLPSEAFNLPLYTHVYVTTDYERDISRFSKSYEDHIQTVIDKINQTALQNLLKPNQM